MPSKPKQKSKDTFEELKRVVHWICANVPCEKLGATQLNKVLWFAERKYMHQTGKRMFPGNRFVKRNYGPVLHAMKPILNQLEDENAITTETKLHYNKTKTSYHAKSKPNINFLEQEKVAMLEEAIQLVCYEHTATSISAVTHDRDYEAAEDGHTIPVETVFAGGGGEITEDVLAWAQQIAEKHQLEIQN